MKRHLRRIHLRRAPHGATCRRARLFDDEGQDLIEYALLAGLLSVGCILSIQAVLGGVIPFFDRIIAALQAAL